MSIIGSGTGRNPARKRRRARDRGVGKQRSRVRAPDHRRLESLAELPEDVAEAVRDIGMDTGERCRAGTYFLADHSVLLARGYRDDVQVMAIADASDQGMTDDYAWTLLAPEADPYTAQAAGAPRRGYFIRARPGARVQWPLQACLFMTQDGLAQYAHNIVVAEEGAELHIITGCGAAPRVRTGLHVGVTEFFVGAGATLTYSMIHSWGEAMAVRPRSAAVIAEGGVFVSNFVSLRKLASLQMDPEITCAGKDATASVTSLLLAPPETELDAGARLVLCEPGCRGEVITRAISTGGVISARGHLTGAVSGVRAHLECRGLILAPGGRIHAVPELEGLAPGVELSHEAAVGRIAEEQITYLMARGLTEQEATATIVRGFLDVGTDRLPDNLADEVRRAVRTADYGGM